MISLPFLPSDRKYDLQIRARNTCEKESRGFPVRAFAADVDIVPRDFCASEFRDERLECRNRATRVPRSRIESAVLNFGRRERRELPEILRYIYGRHLPAEPGIWLYSVCHVTNTAFSTTILLTYLPVASRNATYDLV